MMKEERIDELTRQHGERWVLRDLDFYPEKFSDMWKSSNYNYKYETYLELINGRAFVSFTSEKEAVEACLKIYRDVLHKEPAWELYKRYYELNK